MVNILFFHAYINEMHGSGSKIPSKYLIHIYIYIYSYINNVKFLALPGAPYVYDITRLRFNEMVCCLSSEVKFLFLVYMTNNFF
jgi:hypothetical protein